MMSEMKYYPPVGEVKGKKKEIASMFDAVAPRYDFLNRLLSGGIDRRWRKAAINMLAPHEPSRILDIATGTADLAIEAKRLNPEKIVGVDIAEEMLKLGREKLDKLGLSDLITLQTGDAEKFTSQNEKKKYCTIKYCPRQLRGRLQHSEGSVK